MDVRELSRLMPESMALFDNDAVGVAIARDGIVERCNAKLERMHGSTRGALLGRRLELFDGLPAAGRDATIESCVARDDGGAVWLRATAHAAGDTPGHRRTVWVVEDLSEREHAREAGRRARRRAADMALHIKHTAMKLHEDLTLWRGGPQRDLQFEDRLRAAVLNEEFTLHYQPIVDLRSLTVSSFEALLRWRDESGAWLAPSTFVPVAEASGLIQPLGRWALREACRQAAAWQRQGMPALPIAVNLSPCQLRQPDVADMILDTLAEAGVGPGLIELEITETSLMENIDETLPKLHRLAGGGVHLAIDDFGTGYSSLSYLRRLPIRKLKIDQSFVRELQDECTDFTIVSAVIGLARNLGLTTVAEGVETPEQLRILRDLGCDCCQGFYLCRPVPTETLFGLLGDSPATMPAPLAEGPDSRHGNLVKCGGT